MKDFWVAIGTVAALELLKWSAGFFVATCVGALILAWCLGALWGAGSEKRRISTPTETETRA